MSKLLFGQPGHIKALVVELSLRWTGITLTDR